MQGPEEGSDPDNRIQVVEGAGGVKFQSVFLCQATVV